LFNSVPARLVGLAAISIPFQLISLLGLNVFLALGKTKRFNLIDLAGQSFVLLNAVVALVLLNRSLWLLVGLNTAAYIALALVTIVILWRYIHSHHVESRWRLSSKLLSSALRYGLKFQVAIVAGIVIFRADLLVVNHFRGPAEAGVYAIASQVSMMLMLFPGVVATLLFPRVTAERDGSGVTTSRVTRHLAVIMLLICFATAVGSFALPWIYGRSFAPATLQLLIMVPGVYLIGLEAVLVQHFSAEGVPIAIPLFWIVTLIVHFAGVFALVPTFGAIGAAVASTISYSLIFLLVTFYFLHRTGRPVREVFVLSAAELKGLTRSLRLRS
jgi:O-antigen/teichoic acid export membrane protein